MSKQLIVYMVLSYIFLFGAVFLSMEALNQIEKYLETRRMLKTLERIENKLDQTEALVKRTPCSLESQNKLSDKEWDDRWWQANK